MRPEVELVDRVLDVLQDFSLLSELLRPVRVEVEAEGVQLGMDVASTMRLSVESYSVSSDGLKGEDLPAWVGV